MAESKLLKLKTDLKSLKFEPGNEPYVLFPIGYTKSFETNDSIPQSITDFYLSNRINSDYPLRGGTIDVDLRTQTSTRASQIDKERIKRFLADKPRGPLFITKQIGLQLSNPKIETDTILPALSNVIENTRFYNNGLNTLTQVGVQGTGLHALRHGTIPFNTLSKEYYDTVNQQNVNNSYEANRLVALKLLKLSNNPEPFVKSSAAKLGISTNQNNLFQYLGGPDSVYGVGLTTIKRYDNTEAGTERLASGPNSDKYTAAVLRKYSDIDVLSDTSTMKGGTQTYTQYGNGLYGTGDPGNTSLGSEGRGDRLNMNTLLYFDASKAPWETPSSTMYTKDIIKFVFEAIDNDNPQNATAVFFRAMLSGMSDNHNAAINSFKYLGRGEDFYTYQGVSREIGFSFKIAPQSEEELAPLYKKLNFLISQVYPDYSDRNKIMRAPLMRLTIGDYFYRLPGLIQNVNISVDDNVSWEINSNEPWYGIDSADLKQLPHVINVQCTFKPIHDFLPRRERYSVKTGANGDGTTQKDMNVPFIVNDGSNFIEGDVTLSEEMQNQIQESKQREIDRKRNEFKNNFSGLLNTATTNKLNSFGVSGNKLTVNLTSAAATTQDRFNRLISNVVTVNSKQQLEALMKRDQKKAEADAKAAAKVKNKTSGKNNTKSKK